MSRPTMTVQIANKRDATGKFNNWCDLVVTWEADPVVSEVGDARAYSTKSLQTWIVPDDTGVFWSFTFGRTVPGEYGIRVCIDTPNVNTIWSDTGVAIIIRTRAPLHY